jgi:hypothetical protein
MRHLASDRAMRGSYAGVVGQTHANSPRVRDRKNRADRIDTVVVTGGFSYGLFAFIPFRIDYQSAQDGR